MKADSDFFSPSAAKLALGATVTPSGVVYRVWCPTQQRLKVEIQSRQGEKRWLPMQRDDEGFHQAHDADGRAGDLYAYVFEDGPTFPDPASRGQVEDVRGYSVVIDPHRYAWTDHAWQRPPFRDLVIYELHIGTFTPSGSFAAAVEKLPWLQELGVNAIEIMPLADFPGDRNWGYDGVLMYAPARTYGTPDELRALVDAAHALGLAVIQDVVYNHLGPDGNCLTAFAPQFFDQRRQTPWGATLNYDGAESKYVREFFIQNATYWMDEFHMDGLRLDATHWILDHSEKHLIAEITERVHARGGYVIAEDHRNEAKLVEPVEKKGYGCDAVWADDYHHSVRVSQTGEKHAYLQDFNGTLEETVETLNHGWLFRGQKHALHGTVPRGTTVAHVPPAHLIHCISNHDQTGNRAFGERLHSIIPEASYRAISMMLCLSPYTPMLFMGQEWSCSTPFQFFTDHHPELGRLVTQGRRREFIAFPEFNDPSRLNEIPDPQDQLTFERSKLNWLERTAAPHQGILKLYQECLKLRAQEPAFRPSSRQGWEAGILQRGVGYLQFEGAERHYFLLFHLWPGPEPLDMDLRQLPWKKKPKTWELILSSNDLRFGGTGTEMTSRDTAYVFGQAETLLIGG
ncbi:maltooligosyl trehalose hydrolase [Prosthecobacter debontii]|uniref:Malto-oligosyltrehalose trehalohydrolase n=1 Tax=Prosthecobacter debontii TaxID=48467 RepID=A0A1T4YGW0_9BACT|nr:malto-oligosyltrehalose trehalohydrolase [Prosthecobacter debontii]SKB01009.1 maltooligosyl trehalose hydrolase [Prosthecobacter debontii]